MLWFYLVPFVWVQVKVFLVNETGKFSLEQWSLKFSKEMGKDILHIGCFYTHLWENVGFLRCRDLIEEHFFKI